VKKTHDYLHHYRGYWSEGGVCRIRIYQEKGLPPIYLLAATGEQQHLRDQHGRGYSCGGD
jgi:hypothetical protein